MTKGWHAKEHIWGDLATNKKRKVKKRWLSIRTTFLPYAQILIDQLLKIFMKQKEKPSDNYCMNPVVFVMLTTAV